MLGVGSRIEKSRGRGLENGKSQKRHSSGRSAHRGKADRERKKRRLQICSKENHEENEKKEVKESTEKEVKKMAIPSPPHLFAFMHCVLLNEQKMSL